MKKAKIKTEVVGQNFGYRGVILVRGRRVESTDTYGVRSAAHTAAVSLAARLGYEVDGE